MHIMIEAASEGGFVVSDSSFSRSHMPEHRRAFSTASDLLDWLRKECNEAELAHEAARGLHADQPS